MRELADLDAFRALSRQADRQASVCAQYVLMAAEHRMDAAVCMELAKEAAGRWLELRERAFVAAGVPSEHRSAV